MRCIFCIIFVFTWHISYAQIWQYRYDIIVENNIGSPLAFPWSGGLTAPQFSNIDINQDGLNDLFIFEKADNRIIVFQNVGNDSLKYAPWYEGFFPKLSAWTLLYDFNCDNLPDIFTYATGGNGARVYKASYDGNNWSFTLFKNYITYPSGIFNPNVLITQSDIPGICDIDFDGDVDILTFSFSGNFIEYYKNLSVELGYNCDSIIMQQESTCWGYVKESSLDNSLSLGISCRDSPPSTLETEVHVGSSICCLDYDYNNATDVLLGDYGASGVNYLHNSALANMDSIDFVESNFPSYAPAVQPSFPVAFNLAIDNDSKKDLIVTNNALNNTRYLHNVTYYKNEGITKDSFVWQSDSFLVGDMIDVGKNSYPCIADVDGDGLQDLIIGNNSYYGYLTSSSEVSALTYYRNVGNNVQPLYKLQTRNWLQSLSWGKTNLYPCIADMNNDNKKDLLLGSTDGTLIYLQNTSASSALMFGSPVSNYMGIDVGGYSAPQIVDVNEDNLPDMIIGEIQGRLYYYKNNGVVGSPNFVLESSLWGNVDARMGSSTGYSKPLLTKSLNGDFDLLVGCENGNIIHYNNISGNINGTFSVVDSFFANHWLSRHSALAMSDLDNDGFQDLIVGNIRGGLHWLTSNPNYILVHEQSNNNLVVLYPNPTSNTLQIAKNVEANELILYNIKGQELLRTKEIHDPISIHFTSGIYFVKILCKEKTFLEKIIVQNE